MASDDPVDFSALERKWQLAWEQAKAFEANVDASRPKFFVTFPYPYVNGAPHVGHSYSFYRADVLARYKRLQGFNVLFPQGFHATGEPILGAVERLKKGDEAQLKSFRDSGASEAEIESFKGGPEAVARYWMKRWKEDLHLAGASIDWRRSFITTDLTPTYSRFISWQYLSLKRKGYIVQGTHPVIWCPHDESPTGDHDRLVGEGESPIEYSVLKFTLQEDGGSRLILPCATLRPETVYGVTNLWLNPQVKYVRAAVDGEVWLVSAAAVLKLQDQQKNVEVKGEVPAASLLGKFAVNPLTGAHVMVLPASFVSGDGATGVVMGVPAHAPYDYVALLQLQAMNDADLRKAGVSSGFAKLRELKPLAVISIEGYGEFPAKDACEKMGVRSQKDVDKLEKATSEIYKHEFHRGLLNARCEEFKGLEVSKAKDEITAHFRKKGLASSIWETTAEVTCRCSTRCHVKILENQWFLKFSDQKWKDAVKGQIAQMAVLPQEARLQLLNTVDWLQNKACARKSGLGTKLPWDSAWIVETLSDSTIYMAYYALARVINERKLQPENLPDELFDFIFTGQGDQVIVLKKSGLTAAVLSELKSEFQYFYPVDLRSSGKDLLQNHLIFFLFHHAALFPKEKWPQGIAVNGYVTVEGQKMSKSKGNFIPLRSLLQRHGSDLCRLNMVAAGENMDDADWKEETVPSYRRLLEFLLRTAKNLPHGGSSPAGRQERLLESRLNQCIEGAQLAYEGMLFRSAAHHALHKSVHALRAYLNRVLNADAQVTRKAVETIALLTTPLAPHAAEEIWEALGNKGFACNAAFPSADGSKIDAALEGEEAALESIVEDVARVLKLAKIPQPKLIRLYTAPGWKYRLLKSAIHQAQREGRFDPAGVLKMAFADEELKKNAVLVQAYVKNLAKAVNYYKENPLPEVDENKVLEEQKEVLEKAFNCKVEVILPRQANPENDPDKKAERAVPFKPALYIQ